MCRIPTQTYCKILLSMCMAMCMCISCNIYVALGARGLSRVNSLHTKSLQTFCDLNNLQCVNTIGRPISYTFRSDMNSATSTIDHFV